MEGETGSLAEFAVADAILEPALLPRFLLRKAPIWPVHGRTMVASGRERWPPWSGRHADRHAELAPVLNKVETAPMSAGLMIANVAACNGACPCHYPARSQGSTRTGDASKACPRKTVDEAARPGRRLQRVIVSSLVVSRRPPRVRRRRLSGSRVDGRRCNRCSPPRGLARCGMSRVS
jgi:hypothetical protein